MDILSYFLTVFAVTYLLTDQDAATSHLWQFVVTIVAIGLKYLGFFWLLEAMESRGRVLYKNLSKTRADIFNQEKSWSDKFLTLYSCHLCTGMWVGISMSYLLNVSLLSQNHRGYILTGMIATVVIFFLRDLWNKIIYIKA